MRPAIGRLVTSAITSDTLRDTRRTMFAARRRLSGAQPTIHYFHQADDPYSALAAQMLRALADRYRVRVAPHLVPPPDDSAAPQRQRLADYARRDAFRVARRTGLAFPDGAAAPPPDIVADAQAVLAALDDDGFIDIAPSVCAALWTGETAPIAMARGSAEVVTRALGEGQASREKLGHYLGAMFHFEGEWYWGVDRLHHLEARLASLGLDRRKGEPPVAPWQHESFSQGAGGRGRKIDLWFSFRSPYSCIAFPRVARLARENGAELRLRFILPMVMRGLPVPAVKRLYIVRDCKREADKVGLPFGRIVDPVGVGVERAIAVLHHAIQRGQGEAFAEAALAAAFAEGVDLVADAGLFAVARKAGLNETDVRAALADDSWRPIAEANRVALFDAGLWGAPTFRVDNLPAHWGQDRIWALEEDLHAASAAIG